MYVTNLSNIDFLFLSSTIHTTTPFKLIHMDAWGPYKAFWLTETPYMLILVDDFSRATWTFLLTHKSEVLQYFQNFFHMTDTQFQAKMKAIRSDNGIKFLSNECQQLLLTLRIHHQKSCTYTP